MNYLLKPYIDNDYDYIYNLKKSAYKTYVELNYGKWEETEQQQYFKEYISKAQNNINIVVVDNQQVGFVEVFMQDGVCHIGNICISQEYQNQGIGSQVLKDIINQNQSLDICIRVFKQNSAINLYKRLGFILDSQTDTHYNMIKTKTDM